MLIAAVLGTIVFYVLVFVSVGSPYSPGGFSFRGSDWSVIWLVVVSAPVNCFLLYRILQC